jgi:Prenyltransferase and squalene oxidase repeat
VLGLAAAGKPPSGAAAYLRSQPVKTTADVALRVLALRALGQDASALVARLERARRPSGRIGPLVDSTIWSVLALRSAGRPAGKATVRYLLRQQRPKGGWSWYPRGAPDSNDTAAAVEALRSAGVHGRPIRRGLRYLLRLRNRDGGFALIRGRASDSQSTAWAVQAFVAAGRTPPRAAFRFLQTMRRPDGSYRYSKRYVTTPVFVTAQVLPALMRKPFPLS